MKTNKNSEPSPKNSSPSHSSNIHFAPRGDALKNPVNHFDVAKIRSVSDALDAFNSTSFQSRLLGRCYRIWLQMLNDPERPLIFFGLSGAMIAGGMRRVIRDLIAFHAIDVLVSTGANLSHDLYESLGGRHYMAHRHIADPTLREMRLDRVYDTYADDVKFTETDEFVENFAESLEPRSYSSRELFQLMGERVKDEHGILATAAREKLPVFCPALADSSIGMALTVYRNERRKQSRAPMIYDPMVDNLEIMNLKRRYAKSGVVFIGGGTPKNYIQQVVPMAEIAGLPVSPHSYAIQVTTDDAKWGGLSGCELPESQSWGKLHPNAEQCTVHVDATIGLPLLFTGVMEHYEEWKSRRGLKVDWGEVMQPMSVRSGKRV
ncbi:deoxyhypusine synthase [Candidatus Bathyarchaeota archaeon]|nr:MAG: deoxyhypusine synthase [Candidatus Bathyarchaeota archaeon]TMI29932.1 MAG: deoxyhypusine synthase [Candidatus Bathyarchaeota archaeon]